MNRNRRIFVVVFIIFTAIVALLAIDMASKTTAPWNKKRQLERALPGESNSTTEDMEPDATIVDTLAIDSTRNGVGPGSTQP